MAIIPEKMLEVVIEPSEYKKGTFLFNQGFNLNHHHPPSPSPPQQHQPGINRIPSNKNAHLNQLSQKHIIILSSLFKMAKPQTNGGSQQSGSKYAGYMGCTVMAKPQNNDKYAGYMGYNVMAKPQDNEKYAGYMGCTVM